MSMQQVFTQILVILLYVLTGYAAGKIGLIKPSERKYLTRLCSDLILPFTILSASSRQFSGKEMTDLGLATLLMFGLFTLCTVFSLIYHKARKTPQDIKSVTTGLITYPNCTFLGLPLCQALFGDIAILYSAGAVIAFNVLFFSVQYSLFTGKKFHPRNLLTPAVISTCALLVMLLAGLRFPDPVQTVVSNTGAMITPLTLIIIGVMMAENDIVAVLKEKQSYIITFLRNILIPVAAILLLRIIPIDEQSRMCVLVYIACPCATLPTIYAIQYDMAPELCAQTVLLSTILFAGTLPLIIAIGQWVLL